MLRKYILALAIIAALLLGLVFRAEPVVTVRADKKVDKHTALVVKLAPHTDVKPLAEKYGMKKVGEIKDEDSFLLAPPINSNFKTLMAALAQEAGVVSVEPNSEITTPLLSLRQPIGFPGGDPLVIGTDYNQYQVQPLTSSFQLDAVHAISQGQGVKVAVLDTGIDLNHPALAGRIASDGYDFVNDDNIPFDEPGGSSYGHGTFISGLIILFAPQVQILPLRVIDPNGVGDAFNTAAAIRYAADHGAKVINLSLGTDEKPGVINSAIQYAQKKGCVITAAMGNSNSGENSIFPANVSYVIGVAAVDNNARKASFSNYGKSADLSAPGVELVSAFPGGLYARWSGTSFATPLVSAEAALLFADPMRDANDVISTMERAVIKIDTYQPEFRGELGRGLIAPLSALTRR